MHINSINSTTPKFKGVREDRNTVSQLTKNNDYSLNEPNQRRINQAIENLAKQRGEENIQFLLKVGENLTYETNIKNGKPTKNDWRGLLKGATKVSLANSDPILREKYEPEIKRVFDEPKELTADEKELLEHKSAIMELVDLDSLKNNPNENIRNLQSNMDYFITSTETPIKQKVYVLGRLHHMMTPQYSINPQLKDKKTQVLAEMMNDMVINNPDSKIPNMKAVNQKTHGMCAAISIARKYMAYEDKPNYVDAILSELDSTDKIMIYDRQDVGSGKRIPVKKTVVDFDYAQERGYRIIDASTLQWMGIAGMYGSKNEQLHDFIAFDKENFDAFHDSFFVKSMKDEDDKVKQSYFQSLVKAKDEIKSVKADMILKKVEGTSNSLSSSKNIDMIKKYDENTKELIKSFVPSASKTELKDDVKVLNALVSPSSEKISKRPDNLKKYSFLPNEEASQKIKKVEAYFVDKYSDRVSKEKVKDNLENIVSNIEEVSSLDKTLFNSMGLSAKVARARKLYTAEATYRASIELGLRDNDNLTDYLIHYNLPDRESRISKGYETMIDLVKKDDKRVIDHFSKSLGIAPKNKKELLKNLKQIKQSVDYIQTEGLDVLYSQMGLGSRRELLFNDIQNAKLSIQNGDKNELDVISKTMGVKKDKKVVIKELSKLEEGLKKRPKDEKFYKHAFNKMGYKDEVDNFILLHAKFMENIKTEDSELGNPFFERFKAINGLPQNATLEDATAFIQGIGMTFNTFSQTLENAGALLDIPDDNGELYHTVDGSALVIKKMENEGKIIPLRKMSTLQERFAKIDKLRSSDEFSSRQGKISDPTLYKLTNGEKETIKKIESKINSMYSEVTKEQERVYRLIHDKLEKHARFIGTNEGKYWLQPDGNSGLYTDQQVKILEQLTDKPFKEVEDIDTAIEQIQNGVHSGISSTSVFHDKHGWHAQYIADVKPVGKDGKMAIFHDNTWGASEHENTWIDSEGLMRTDYSDHRGGELGYITDETWKNGNYVDNLTKKAGHITHHEVDSKNYKKIVPVGEDYDFATISGIIVEGKNSEYKDIAGSIKDTIFVPDTLYIDDLEKYAKNMTAKEIQKAIFKNETAGTMYKDKLKKLEARVKGNSFKKGIEALEEYNKLPENDPVKITFEKASIRLAYPDATLYDELGRAFTMKDVQKVKAKQRQIALENFDYAFSKTTDTFKFLRQEHAKDAAQVILDALQNNGLPIDKASNIANGIFKLDKDEKANYTGSVKETIKFINGKISKQFDEAMGTSEDVQKAKSEMLTGMTNLLSDLLYFNKEDLKSDTNKAKGIQSWIDEKFKPENDEEFVIIYRNLQDMRKEDFAKLRDNLTNKQLGISDQTGYDMLVKYKAANDNVESTVRNLLFYEEYLKDMNVSKTKPAFKLSKTERKTRGAYYVGQRTFDDLYRSMSFTLDTLTYEKFFNKYKDVNYRKYGAFPAYPRLKLENNKTINNTIETLYEKVAEGIGEIIQKKSIERDYQITDELEAFTKNIDPDKKLTTGQRKHLQKLAGEFITLNMNDTSVSDSLEAAYKILELDKNSKYQDIKADVDTMVKEFGVIKEANSSVNLNDYMKSRKEIMDKYTDTIINISIPPRYQGRLKEKAKKWQDLEIKFATKASASDDKLKLLQQKINKQSIMAGDEKQIVSFERLNDLVLKTKGLTQAKKPNEEKIAENEKKIAEMTEKFVNSYIKPEAKENIRSNIKDWTHKELHGGKKLDITEDMVINARDEFEADFLKYHLTKNPKEVLNTFLLLSAKDAKEKYPKTQDNVEIYKTTLNSELSLSKYVEIQDELMEAVRAGNTAHVREYFDDYKVLSMNGSDDLLSMNSDESLAYIIANLLMEDNTKTAKMFVEKLGLGDRVIHIQKETIDAINPKKQVDAITKYLRTVNNFQTVVNDEYANLKSIINDVENPDDAIEQTKQNILKRLQRKAKDKTIVKGYLQALDDAKTSIKENPEMTRDIMLGAVNSEALKEIQEYINETLKEKQESLNSAYSIYHFLLDLRLPEYSDGFVSQQKLKAEFDELLQYNNEQLTNASKDNDNFYIKTKDI